MRGNQIRKVRGRKALREHINLIFGLLRLGIRRRSSTPFSPGKRRSEITSSGLNRRYLENPSAASFAIMVSRPSDLASVRSCLGVLRQSGFLMLQQPGTKILRRESNGSTNIGKGERPVTMLFHEPLASVKIPARCPLITGRRAPLNAANRIFQDCEHKLQFRFSATFPAHNLPVLLRCERVDVKQRRGIYLLRRTFHRIGNDLKFLHRGQVASILLKAKLRRVNAHPDDG